MEQIKVSPIKYLSNIFLKHFGASWKNDKIIKSEILKAIELEDTLVHEYLNYYVLKVEREGKPHITFSEWLKLNNY